MLVPMHSRMTKTPECTLLIRSMIFFYGIRVWLLITKEISNLTEKEYRIRELAIHYYHALDQCRLFLTLKKIMISLIMEAF